MSTDLTHKDTEHTDTEACTLEALPEELIWSVIYTSGIGIGMGKWLGSP